MRRIQVCVVRVGHLGVDGVAAPRRDWGLNEQGSLQMFSFLFNPLVPRVQEIKIRNSTLNRLLIVEFVKKMVYLGAPYSERQELIDGVRSLPLL